MTKALIQIVFIYFNFIRPHNQIYVFPATTKHLILGKDALAGACKIQSTLGFATMGKAANLALATRNAVTDLF